MISLLRAEFKKLLSVRSTYIVSLVTLALVALATGYGSGYRGAGPGHGTHLTLSGTLMQTASIVSAFVAIVAILQLAHEYRYNTIMYSLTSSNSRSKFLAAKLLMISMYVAGIAIVYSLLGLAFALLGAHFAGATLPHQDLHLVHFLMKSVYYCLGYALAGTLFVALTRNLTAGIAILFLAPGPIEALLGLVLKTNAKYLPFTALSPVIAPPGKPDAALLSPLKGALVFAIYLVVGWIVAWYLFLKRDAN
jgi:ABC-type transport system involved in multi-copper enzyme maturation permease subunit